MLISKLGLCLFHDVEHVSNDLPEQRPGCKALGSALLSPIPVSVSVHIVTYDTAIRRLR